MILFYYNLFVKNYILALMNFGYSWVLPSHIFPVNLLATKTDSITSICTLYSNLRFLLSLDKLLSSTLLVAKKKLNKNFFLIVFIGRYGTFSLDKHQFQFCVNVVNCLFLIEKYSNLKINHYFTYKLILIFFHLTMQRIFIANHAKHYDSLFIECKS